MMNNPVPHKNYWLLLFGVAALLILTGIVSNMANSPAIEEKQADKVISEQDIQRVEMNTEGFLTYFVGGFPLDQQRLTDITFDYFSPQFLENDFSESKSSLFGLYGFEKLMHTYTTPEGLKREGGIDNYVITDIQKDNANKTITVYISMDALGLNDTHWIEWRNIPSHGWKINALSFHGNIESLEKPLSPKKQL